MKHLFVLIALLTSISVQAGWYDRGSIKDPMDDTVVQSWVNVSTNNSARLEITNQTYKGRTDVYLSLWSNNSRWLPYKTVSFVNNGETYYSGVLYGRIRVDNDEPIEVRFSFSDGNENKCIGIVRSSVNTIIDRGLVEYVAKGRKVLVEVYTSRSGNKYESEILTFNK